MTGATTEAPTTPGRLVVRVEDHSYFLSTTLPFVVRDARLAVVRRGVTGPAQLELPAGLYCVEAITPRGRAMRELVPVVSGERSEVVVTADSGREPREASEEDDLDYDLGPGPSAQVDLLDTQGCSGVRHGPEWDFEPEALLSSVPTATFRVGEATWIVSLPLNPVSRRPEESGCSVEIEPEHSSSWLQIRFAAKRRVGRTVDGLLRHHETMAGTSLLDEAAELLLHKYSDPAAAALGGLTLHRLGRLRERQGWVENLARDFPWIPDGRILLAGLLLEGRDEAELSRGLELLLAAAADRPLYTDGLSLASELLRRWPGELRADERAARLESLAAYSCVADWDAVALTTRADESW